MLYEKVRRLCKEKDVTVTQAEKELEFGRGSLSKIDKHKPSYGKISMLAGYFGVPTDFFLEDPVESDGEDEPDGTAEDDTAALAQQMFEDPDMRALFHIKRNMDPERFKAHKRMMADMYRLEHPEDDYDFGD